MIAIDLSKQQALDADPKVIQQISFTGNLENNLLMFFIIEENENCVRFFTRNGESIVFLYRFNIK